MKGARMIWLDAAILCLALAPSAFVAFQSLDMPHLGAFHDDGLYWVCGKSLAQGSGYRILSLPEQPFQTKYPPLYPLLLAGIWKLAPEFPANLRLATALAWLALPVYLLLCRKLFTDLGLGAAHARVLVVLLGLNSYVIFYSISLMSEVPFTCLLLACFLVGRRAGEPGASRWTALAAGALGAAAYLMRNAALPLLVAAPLYYAWRKRYAQAAVFFGAMFPAVAAWYLWVRAHQLDTSDPLLLYYTDYVRFHLASFRWADAPLLVLKNLAGTLEGTGSALMVFDAGALARVLGVAVLWGCVRLGSGNRGLARVSPADTPACPRFSVFSRVGRPHFPYLFAAGYLLLLQGWHLGLGYRYVRLLLPLLPLLLAGFSEVFRRAAVRARDWFGSTEARRIAGACATATVLGLIAVLAAANMFATLWRAPGYTARARESLAGTLPAYRWIADNLPQNATFLAGHEPVLYLYTGRRGYRPVVPPGLLYRYDWPGIAAFYRGVGELARRHGVSYVLLRAGGGEAEVGDPIGIQRLITESPALEPVYRSAWASVYRVKPGG
jgi:hypothetical protein